LFKKNFYPAVLCSLLFVLSACAAPAAAPTTAPTENVAATETVVAIANSNGVATSVAATLTAQPSATPLPTNTPLPTSTTQPSDTPKPTDTATVAPSATSTTAPKPSATHTKVAVVTTKAPVTQPPAATKAPAASGSGPLYSTASGGPQGYTSFLGCTQSDGSACQTVMAPGDKAFSIRLEAGNDAVPAIFVPFGLSVEKDGANVADAYMTVVSGWLNPNEYALLGTSHSFSQPGHYVIRTNGCYVTRETYPNCSWGTVNGTIVTFDIQ
jgi:hypothetical protein